MTHSNRAGEPAPGEAQGSVLLGRGRHMLRLPRAMWQRHLQAEDRLGFMSEEHHLVRNFVVRELPRLGQPLSPRSIAQELGLQPQRVIRLLDDLEQHKTFLFRNKAGAVTWAYPVTVAQTPHLVTFDSGELVHAAWAIDAIATPFVQGRLRGEPLSVRVATECGHCQQPLELDVDSELRFRVLEEAAEPLVYVPMVDFDELQDPSIIDAFWRKSIFFWSEEHARQYRRNVGGEQGVYLTLPQATYLTQITQSALFGFQPGPA